MEEDRQIMRAVERLAGNYRTKSGGSPAIATRDLVERGALVRTGDRRYARYWLSVGEEVDSK